MTILSKDVLVEHGPYICFADVAGPIDERVYGGLNRFTLKPFTFFMLSVDLLESYCMMTNSFSPIDPYESVQLDKPQEIKELATEILLWAIQLLRTKQRVFKEHVADGDFYQGTTRYELGGFTGEHLRQDLVDTLLYLAGEFSRIASNRRCLVISGV